MPFECFYALKYDNIAKEKVRIYTIQFVQLIIVNSKIDKLLKVYGSSLTTCIDRLISSVYRTIYLLQMFSRISHFYIQP